MAIETILVIAYCILSCLVAYSVDEFNQLKKKTYVYIFALAVVFELIIVIADIFIINKNN